MALFCGARDRGLWSGSQSFGFGNFLLAFDHLCHMIYVEGLRQDLVEVVTTLLIGKQAFDVGRNSYQSR